MVIKIVAVVAALAIWVIYGFVHHFRKKAQRAQGEENPDGVGGRRLRGRAGSRGLPGRVCALIVVFALVIAVAASATKQFIVYKLDLDETEQETWDPAPEGPISSADDIEQGFLLSEVDGSEMLNLGKEDFAGKDTTADDLQAQSKWNLDWLEMKRNIGKPVPLYPGITISGDDTLIVSFHVAESFEDCNEQIACAKRKAEQAESNQDKVKFYELMAISALDGLYLCECMGMEEELYWFYAEIAFHALVNQYIYSWYNAPSLSDLYYRMGQVFDYLGGIADTEELQFRMYFVSTAFFTMAYRMLEERSFERAGAIYWDDVWSMYLTMLYREELYVQKSGRESFYKLALECQKQLQPLDLTTVEQAAVEEKLGEMRDCLGR